MSEEQERVGLRELALAFVLKANFTYGGGSATIATLHDDLVDRRRWVKEEPFALSYALSRLTPARTSWDSSRASNTCCGEHQASSSPCAPARCPARRWLLG